MQVVMIEAHRQQLEQEGDRTGRLMLRTELTLTSPPGGDQNLAGDPVPSVQNPEH